MAKIGPRDNQKSKLYRGENEAFERYFRIACSDLKEAQAVAILLWRRARVPEGVPAPTVVEAPRLRTTARYNYGQSHIIRTNAQTLSGQGLSVAVIAHETAHAVMNANGLSHLVQPHGPEFAHTYARMISVVGEGQIDFATAVRLLRAQGVKVLPEWDPTAYSGDYYQWTWTPSDEAVPMFSRGKRAMETQIRNSKFNLDNFAVCKIPPHVFFAASSQ